ncbi:hypothetical protein RUM44_002526 [Polyplax serrata]|uniref:Uncharacterized protein n=1 Tax=Polyplax serrata TaxID=468196 RepID=A0ABR1AF19_POLSC
MRIKEVEAHIMVSVRRHSISTFLTKSLWIFFIIFHEFNLVICDPLEDDNLKKALKAIERRQRDLELQENEYYGQPEDIGYGFQKTFGFFDSNGPASELGSFSSDPKTENEYQGVLFNYQGGRDGEKRKSNFRERMTNDRMNYLSNEGMDREDDSQSSIEYLQMLKNLWSKYRQSRNDDLSLEDLTDEQLEDILNSMNDRESGEDQYVNDYRSSESNGLKQYEVIPIRLRKNYRVFEEVNGKNKRYPSFGEGIYGKRNYHYQHSGYESIPENDYPHSVKYTIPEFSREGIDGSRESSYEELGDGKDRDLVRILNNAIINPKYIEDDEPYWSKDQSNYDDELWLQGPVSFPEDWYDNSGRNEKRMEIAPKYFKQHNGIHINTKRFPVKRSSVRVRKEVKGEKASKELKGIFGTSTSTTVPPKKGTKKKPTEILKKQNVTKPAVTKLQESKKVVRSVNKVSQERVLPLQQNEEIVNLFKVNKKSLNKKSIDWSQYFGIDKRSQQNWLNNDYVTRAESHFLTPKSKRYYADDRGNLGRVSDYQMPFDTRRFNKKSYPNDIGNNIDKVETKIGDIEEKIIDDALKYTGAHSGVADEDLAKVKGKVIQHLEAAYSLEKMKNALEEFKNLIKPEKSVATLEMPKKSVTEAPKSEPQTTCTYRYTSSQKLTLFVNVDGNSNFYFTASVSKENANLEKPLVDKKSVGEISKRPAVKKEGVKDIFNREPESLEFLNDASYSTRQYDSDECPVLDQILQNCLRLEEMGGKYAEMLVPLCSLQQVCYFCGNEIGFTKMSMCDSMYLTEAQNVCQDNRECLVNARDSLMGLRDLYEQEFMSKNSRRLMFGSCLSNPCIQRYFLNSPGAIYSLEVQK